MSLLVSHGTLSLSHLAHFGESSALITMHLVIGAYGAKKTFIFEGTLTHYSTTTTTFARKVREPVWATRLRSRMRNPNLFSIGSVI